MNGEPIRFLSVQGSPSEMGHAHGSTFAASIQAYAADRIRLAATGTNWDEATTLALAERMLPAHEAYDADLYAEMVAMAEAAGISAAAAVIVGGYTDFIDTVRVVAGGTAVEDNCTAVIVPDSAADGAGFLAQTWDMHASATPHVILLGVAPASGPQAMVFTTGGALGQIGMNDAGIAVGINNLTVDDGKVGVTWPFVVRKALRQTTYAAALDCIMEAELAGAHNYLLFDGYGNGASIEATPTVNHVAPLQDQPLVHTNHCLVAATQAVEGRRPRAMQDSSINRLEHATDLLATRPITAEDLEALTRDERSICRRPEPPFDYESSGATIMRPATGDFWACWGVPADNEYQHFKLAQHRSVS